MNAEKLKKEIMRFFSNPNTLTFIFAIIAIVILYKVYAYMVDSAVQPTPLFYATTTIYESEQVNEKNMSKVEIAGSFLTSQSGNLAKNYASIYNRYVQKNYRIPANSFFYTEALTTEDSHDSTVFTNLKDNYTIFRLNVDFHNTYGCSIMDGDYIDIFLKTHVVEEAEEGSKLVYNLFVKSIQVLMVVDKSGKNVFTNTREGGSLSPYQLYFAVPIETYKMLEIAQRGTKYDIELIPVPRDTSYSENPEEPSIASQALKDLIYSQASDYL